MTFTPAGGGSFVSQNHPGSTPTASTWTRSPVSFDKNVASHFPFRSAWPESDWNIDHVAVGQQGVLIETKARNRTRNTERKEERRWKIMIGPKAEACGFLQSFRDRLFSAQSKSEVSDEPRLYGVRVYGRFPPIRPSEPQVQLCNPASRTGFEPMRTTV